MWKKTIAMLLVVIMIGGAAPLGALAEMDWATLPNGTGFSLFTDGYNAVKSAVSWLGDRLQGLSLRASAATYAGECGADGDNVTWSLDTETGVLTISGSGEMRNFDYDHYKYSCWHPYSSFVQSVVFDYGVSSIGAYSFFGCTHLSQISIPDSVTTIGFASFCKCTSVSDIIIPDSVNQIDACAFYDCSGLASLVIGKNVNTIGNCAFRDCIALKTMQFRAKKCKYAGDKPTDYSWYLWGECRVSPAFFNCSALQDVTIDHDVTIIPENMFYNCVRLTQINLPADLQNIGENAFFGTALYTDADNWMDGVLYIDNSLITTDRLLSGTYNVREGTVCLADAALKGCENLSVLEIPASVLGIGTGMFENCEKLTEIHVAPANPAYCSDDYGVLYNKERTTLLCCPCMSRIETYKISDNVTVIDDNAFYHCRDLKSITFPDSLTRIGNSSFCGCGLFEANIPDSVTEIGESAFSSCSKLTSVQIPDSVTVIRKWIFSGCGLKGITIGESVTEIEEQAFYYTPLQNVTFGPHVQKIGSNAFGSKLVSVCYSGSVDQWLAIDMESNGSLTSAPRYYHTHNDSMPTEVRDVTEATCYQDGYSGDMVYLPCGAVKQAGSVIPALGHNYVTTEPVPSCTRSTTKTVICSRCGQHDWNAEVVIPAQGHLWSDGIVTEPTCNESGYTTVTCNRCSEQVVQSWTPPLGHDWDNGVVTREPSCTETGITTFTCKRDASHTHEENTPAKGHMFGAWQQTKVATTEEEGEAQRRCSVCGGVETITLAKLPAPEKLTLNKTSVTLNYKDSETLTASEAVTWTSSNEKVIKVDAATGKLTTVGKGTATVTAHSVQGDRTATCEVTVKYTFIQILIRIFLLGFIWY